MIRKAGILLLLVGVLWGCRPQSHRAADSDFTTEVYKPRYAKGFSINASDSIEAVLISVNNPWQGAEKEVASLLIVDPATHLEEGFAGQVLRGYARRIVTTSTSHVAMLEALGAGDRIVGTSGLNYIYSDSLRSRSQPIADIGPDGNVDYELLVSLRPDIVLLYGVNGPSPMENKLRQLGIPYAYLGDYLEESPLGKAEWIVVMGQITGLQQEAVHYFQRIPPQYLRLKQKVDSLASTHPKVMLNTPYADAWFMPSAQSYMVRLITDAGGDYLLKSMAGNSSVAIDSERALVLVGQADVWLNTGSINSISELTKTYPNFAKMPCVEGRRVYNNTLRSHPHGGNDFFESAVMNPHLVLSDLIKILHPELIADSLHYYQQL